MVTAGRNRECIRGTQKRELKSRTSPMTYRPIRGAVDTATAVAGGGTHNEDGARRKGLDARGYSTALRLLHGPTRLRVAQPTSPRGGGKCVA